MNNILSNENWIFGESKASRNIYLKFRKTISDIKNAEIIIAADSRYFLWCNNKFIGSGGIRDYKDSYFCDKYNLHDLNGKLTVAVLVLRMGESNFQYSHSESGLSVQISDGKKTYLTDSSWKYIEADCYQNNVPRISLPLFFEEQFDAAKDDEWRADDYDDSKWRNALVNTYKHKQTKMRDIPFLCENTVLPNRHIESKYVQSYCYKISFSVRDKIIAPEKNSTPYIASMIVSLKICCLECGEFDVVYKHGVYELFSNGEQVVGNKISLEKGTNFLSFVYDGDLRFFYDTSLAIDAPAETLNLNLVGAFDVLPDEKNKHYGFGYFECVDGYKIDSTQRHKIYEAVKTGQLNLVPPTLITDLSSNIFPADIFLETFCQKEIGDLVIDNNDNFFTGKGYVCITSNNKDVRLLIDFGTELTGYLEFDVISKSGCIMDFSFFEFIQPDKRRNYAEGMHNTMRYITAQGKKHYRSLFRRGFRYLYITLRNCDKIEIGNLNVAFSHYPFKNQGNFFCSDFKLNKIYETAKHTIKCCMEDVYVDCPSYEQVLWVGDMRNEALCDYFINGDSRLWLRCLKLTGQSLKNAPLTLSQVPSGWYNIIPDWSFLFMRSCCEYYKYTGDYVNSIELLNYVEKSIDGIEKLLDKNGLFYIEAWNMFDWADMDTPENAVVTHQNCLCYLSIKECCELALALKQTELCAKWQNLAQTIKHAVQKHLWCDDKQCFTDCARYNGDALVKSEVLSQQTQTVAYISGIFPEKNESLKNLMNSPPDNFIKAGSPFFEFFRLEGMIKDVDCANFINTILSSWGFMAEMQADTFWEMWSGKLVDNKRLTRSHCHGWSAAPIFFLSEFVLGVTVMEPGFKQIKITPHPCGLKFVRGTVPTPYGIIEISYTSTDGKIVENLSIILPPQIKCI